MKITWQLAILLVSYPLSFSFKSILYSLLWETLTLTLQPTVPSPYIQASVNRRHWREGWKEREETASYLFSLIFFPYSFLLSSQPCSKRESWLQSSASFVSPAIGPTTLHCRHQRPGGIHLLFRDLSTKATHEPSRRNLGFCCYLFPHIRFYQLLSLTELSFLCLLF